MFGEVAGRVRVKVGPGTASYAGTARFVSKDEAAHRFVIEGNGRETRGTGTASATVEISMSEQDAVTRVWVVTSLEVTGKQAQFGRGVMADIAAKLTDQFAACLAERARGPAPAAEPSASPQAVSPQALSPQALSHQALSHQAAAPQDGLVLGLLLSHRRRIVIMTAAAPGSYPPARTVL
jgi:carbon monoxide dehydrogenase subunit G